MFIFYNLDALFLFLWIFYTEKMFDKNYSHNDDNELKVHFVNQSIDWERIEVGLGWRIQIL